MPSSVFAFLLWSEEQSFYHFLSPRRVEPCEYRAGEGEADCSGSVACSGVVLGRQNSSPWVLGVFVETHKGAESILINFPKAAKPQNLDYSPTSPTT